VPRYFYRTYTIPDGRIRHRPVRTTFRRSPPSPTPLRVNVRALYRPLCRRLNARDSNVARFRCRYDNGREIGKTRRQTDSIAILRTRRANYRDHYDVFVRARFRCSTRGRAPLFVRTLIYRECRRLNAER